MLPILSSKKLRLLLGIWNNILIGGIVMALCKEEKAKIAPSILDLEKRVRQMSRELDEEAIIIRNTEIQYKK